MSEGADFGGLLGGIIQAFPWVLHTSALLATVVTMDIWPLMYFIGSLLVDMGLGTMGKKLSKKLARDRGWITTKTTGAGFGMQQYPTFTSGHDTEIKASWLFRPCAVQMLGTKCAQLAPHERSTDCGCRRVKGCWVFNVPFYGKLMGMPSGHSMTSFFGAVFWSLYVFTRNKPIGLKALSIFMLIAIAGIVAWSRIINKCHSWAQVIIGGVIGILFAVTWFWLTAWIHDKLNPDDPSLTARFKQRKEIPPKL
jgi:membrane-associated phospholipid phosphatase